MTWQFQIGQGKDQRWYWHLVETDTRKIIAVDPGGGHGTLAEADQEVQLVRQVAPTAPAYNVGRISYR